MSTRSGRLPARHRRHGKTTFVETLRQVLGPDYTVEVAETLLIATRSEQHPTEVVDLRGKRLATVSELESGKRFNVAKFKKLTGGDRLKVRRMHQDFFEWYPTHAFVMTGNRRPEMRGSDDAFWRRMRIVKFEVVIPRDSQQDNLAGHLAEEHGSCVLAWLVRGMKDLRAQGIGEPASVKVATEDYRRDEEHIAAFIDDVLVHAPERGPPRSCPPPTSTWSTASGARGTACATGRHTARGPSSRRWRHAVDVEGGGQGSGRR